MALTQHNTHVQMTLCTTILVELSPDAVCAFLVAVLPYALQHFAASHGHMPDSHYPDVMQYLPSATAAQHVPNSNISSLADQGSARDRLVQ